MQVSALIGRVIFVGAAASVYCNGNVFEEQMCYVEDATGQTGVQVWNTEVDALEVGKKYKILSLSTREFRGNKFVTTTKNTRVLEVSP